MADKKVILEVELIEGNANSKLNELKASLQSLDKTHKDYEPTLKLIAQAERDLSKAQQNRILVEKGLMSSSTKVDKATKRTAKEMKQLSSDTGASTSATLELGRVFSDAPYGIRGVANNIQQLASNLFFMSKKTDEATGKTVGFKGAVGSLIGNLVGPAGVLVAFQAAIALLDWFSNRTESAKEAASNFKQEVEELAKVLGSSLNVSVKEYIKLIRDKKLLDEEMLKTSEEQAELESKLNSLQEYRTDLEEKKKKSKMGTVNLDKQIKVIQLKEIEIQDKIAKLYEDAANKVNNYNKAKDAQTAATAGTIKALELEKSKAIAYQKTISSTSKIWKEEAEKIKVIQAKIDAITGGTKKKGSVKKISPFKTPKELELDVKNNEKALIEFNKKLEEYDLKTEMNNKLSAAKTEKERFDIKKLYATKLLTAQIDAERETLKLNKSTELEIAKAKTAAHIADIKRAFELFKIKTELDKNLTPKQKESLIGGATGKMFDAIGQADKEIEDTEKGINDRYKPIFKLFEEVKVARFAALFSGFKDKEKQEDELAKLESYAKKAKEILNGIGDFVDAEYQRELSIEQNKTNVLNNELNQRLLNENLSKEQRKTIQNEIAQNDEKLRKKQESIEKKRFKAQKAINIATALIDTGVAAVKALKNNGGVPTGLPAMFGTIALGLAQVATIARTKFQSSAGSSPVFAGGGGGSSSGGGTGRAEASFNIVGGRTKEDALLGAIQAKFDQPVRAYVVSGDVTSQQELDRVIVSSSSL